MPFAKLYPETKKPSLLPVEYISKANQEDNPSKRKPLSMKKNILDKEPP